MPIDIYEHYRPKINALAREQGIPEEIIEPKSIKYGTEYSFPANMHYEFEEGGVRMYEKYVAYMSDKYNETILQAIAAEARKEGFNRVAILDKWKILKALAAANPEDFPDMVKVVRCKDCANSRPIDKERRHETVFYEECVWCQWFDTGMYPDEYCSYGKRKEE